ncbi:MAG: hypothetical protein PHQ93_06525 [Sulfurimonas sp.]|uniref:hypothetical protein n=1 Tax=Sulfurimonas sp. TaxID=2022749 RepID=UPI00260363E7|nr:hypothetical protein [Sulfurimonas sp.]MDD5400821.1 hypothetical protein [Sulfurimonas sp.]MDP2893344.1 hypothetical protein [Sulfurimonas sp.]
MIEEIKIVNQLLEIKQILLKQQSFIDLLLPKKISVSYLVEKTGKSRQSIREYLINNFEPEEDFWKEGARIYVSRETAITIQLKGL